MGASTPSYAYGASAALFARASRVIPCGIYGHYSPAPCIPITSYPWFTSRAEGSHFWDVDGNEFIDYMCAYGPMILGYRNPVVDAAYEAQARQADTVTCASPAMVGLAEFLVNLIAGADWAFFAKNGTDVTTYAVMVARAATGRRRVIAVEGGYHGTAPWMQGAGHHGVLEEDAALVFRIPWNDVASLERVLDDWGHDIAAFIATPYHHPIFADSALPAEGYWARVEQLLHKHGVVLISDDVRCGFRLDMRGSHAYFGYHPDLVCFSKAIANGHPLSALVGTDALRTAAAKVFYSGSFWFSAAPMAAALACLQELQRLDGPAAIMALGRKLTDGMVAIARGHGYDLKVTGAPSMPYLRIADDESLMFHQRLCGECTRRGAYFTSHHNWFLSAAHTGADLQRTWDIYDDALRAVTRP